MTVVSNTGPLIALAKANRLDLLEALFGHVQIPSEVHRELLAGRGPEMARLVDAVRRFIRVVPMPPTASEVQAAIRQLEVGEQEAIGLAYESRMTLMMDDRSGRTAARRLGLSVVGVAGVLVRAKETGLIPAVRPLLEEIRQQGYWLSDELIEEACRLAGEGRG